MLSRYVLLGGFMLAQCVFGDSLRVATYNLDNYLVMNRRVNSSWRPNYPKPENEKLILRQVIVQTAPDILAVQEIGPVSFLEELRADLALEGVHYPYAVHLEANDEKRHIALLSKVPPKDVVKHTDLEFKYFDRRERVKRGLLEVSFAQPDGGLFKLFVVHLKSRYTEDKEDPEATVRRTKEAEACRNRIIERTFEREQDAFLVLGDLNDHPNSAAFRRFYRRGNLNITSLLPAADSRGELWTYFYRKQATYSLVDAILVSEEIADTVKAGSGTVVDLPGVLGASDHRMVYVDLMLGDAAPTATK